MTARPSRRSTISAPGSSHSRAISADASRTASGTEVVFGRLASSLTTTLGEQLVDSARAGFRRSTQLGAQAVEELAPPLEHETAGLDVRHQRLAGLDPQLPPQRGRDHYAPLRTDAQRDRS